MDITADAVLVVGQTARDLVLRVDELPEHGARAAARERLESFGGKGANQAVALARLGLASRLLSVVGDDVAAAMVLQAVRDEGVDVEAVVRRSGRRTGLVVEIVDGEGGRFVEDLHDECGLTPGEVGATPAFDGVGTVLVQLAVPAATALAAARRARSVDARVVLDGAPADATYTADLLASADAVRADAEEADVLVGRGIEGADDAVAAARELLEAGPGLVVLAAGSSGNAVAWRDADGTPRSELLALPEVSVVDTTGAGDAFAAALTAALVRRRAPFDAARAGVDAAAATVGHLGGRPRLDPGVLDVGAGPRRSSTPG